MALEQGRRRVRRRFGTNGGRSPSSPSQSLRASTARHSARSHLPTRRAVTGGILIAVAASGVLVAHRSASAPPTDRYVVATAQVPAGHVLEAEDLGTIAIDLPNDVPAVSAEAAAELVGRVTRSRLEPLALVRPGDVFEDQRFADPDSVEVAVELAPARALSGTIGTGDLVDVLSTGREEGGTRTVAHRARVSHVDAAEGDDGIGADGSVQVRLALPDGETAEAVVDASIRSELSLVLPAPNRGNRP